MVSTLDTTWHHHVLFEKQRPPKECLYCYSDLQLFGIRRVLDMYILQHVQQFSKKQSNKT